MDTAFCRVLLVPYPIPPLVGLAFLVWKKLGMLADDVYIQHHRHTGKGEPFIEFFGEGTLWKVAQSRNGGVSLFEHIRLLIKKRASPDAGALLLRMLRFVYWSNMEKRKERGDIETWLMRLTLLGQSPHKVLEAAASYFDGYLSERRDPWKEWVSPPHESLPELKTVGPKNYPSGVLPVDIAIAMEEDGQPVTALTSQELVEGKLCELKGKKFLVVVGGHSGAGKSTLAGALVHHGQHAIKGICSHPGWENFCLDLRLVTMDLATPTVQLIMAGHGKLRTQANAAKQPWKSELVWEALAKVRTAFCEGADIVITDLPGKITPITEILAALADFGILISKDPNELNPWRKFMEETIGTTIVAEMRSSEQRSCITKYIRGRFLGGNLQSPDRSIQPDAVIHLLSKLLLLEFLPTLLEEQRESLHGIHLMSQSIS